MRAELLCGVLHAALKSATNFFIVWIFFCCSVGRARHLYFELVAAGTRAVYGHCFCGSAPGSPGENCINLTGPTKTVPRPGRKRLISRRIGRFVIPVQSNGRENGRQLDVPLILPIAPEPA